MYQLVIQKRITKRENEVLSEYLDEVAQEPLLSPDEEVELAKRIKEGDEIARDKLIRANLRFVISVAKQFSQTGLPLTDLINEGNIGLIKAAEKFDETKGFKFISYAVWWIRQCIIQAISENCRMIRLPSNKIASANKIKNAYSLLEQIKLRPPTLEELSDMTSMPVQQIKDLIKYVDNNVDSLDESINDDGETTMLDFVPNINSVSPDSDLERESLKIEINRIIETLSINEKMVIKYYYGLEHTHALSIEEISDRMNMSAERVRKIRDKAIKKLKNNKDIKFLNQFFN
ncbi:MAG TPA: RNA polymerase sigma factor RpoD/SigA [Bacteroidales bacterium]|jgi:RNA polymerase primary sigma factor|nr:RNA polymerase sigma factor RpoD/SigA [Bacteroidales bacterium]HOJ23882.1 RNA polymerase sigma factor RpoD/SigA [Bacteroidales bacterium]HON98136.1 RNA polymerase sigma factor RpoD/SigA [Bacteroidales bacterium]HOU82793.1 RNA polymerase sigma factor RpoD/SigA [Bacteroidales bacterium]HPX45946.1 RNA polymerase sigma factor RpoD/SigA [Bacteroidales bacterium]